MPDDEFVDGDEDEEEKKKSGLGDDLEGDPDLGIAAPGDEEDDLDDVGEDVEEDAEEEGIM